MMNFVTVFDKNDEAAIRAAIEAAGGKIL